MKAVVIGSGSWGTGLAQVLCDNKVDVTIYGNCESEINDINENHRNSKYFGGIQIHPDLKATTDINVVKGSDIVVLSVPTIAIESVCKQIDEILDKKTIIVNTSKGFHPETFERMSCVIRENISEEHLSSVVSLIGPSHAEEVVIRMLTTICAVSLNEEDAKTVQETFSNEYLRIYTGTDEIGSEVGVAVKNAIALASGILSGLGYGDNTRAALMTRGLMEMTRFGVAMGGKKETFMGMTGIGDLIVTCLSEHSRNRRAGKLIGQGKSLEETKKEVGMVIESIDNIEVAYELSKIHNVEMPIVEMVYKVIYENLNPKEAVKKLMTRDKKSE